MYMGTLSHLYPRENTYFLVLKIHFPYFNKMGIRNYTLNYFGKIGLVIHRTLSSHHEIAHHAEVDRDTYKSQKNDTHSTHERDPRCRHQPHQPLSLGGEGSRAVIPKKNIGEKSFQHVCALNPRGWKKNVLEF